MLEDKIIDINKYIKPHSIEFEYWNGEEMIESDSLAFEEYAPIKDLLNQKGIRQYIGIKDINGKKVFQGDIVKLTEVIFTDCSRKEIEETKTFTGIVVQYQFSWCLFRPKENGGRIKYLYYFDNADTMEVLGDIFRNPEMILKIYKDKL